MIRIAAPTICLWTRAVPAEILELMRRPVQTIASDRLPRCGLAGLAALLVVLCIVGGGCATPLDTIDQARLDFASGDAGGALAKLKPIAEKSGRFAEPAALDLAMIELATGDPRSAERRLRELRDRFDALPAVDLTHEAAAIVRDDTARRYRPAGYEEVMVRAMLAVCSLAGDASDAESYALQAAEKQAALAKAAAERGLLANSSDYEPIALAPYLRGVLREATHQNYDDAARAYQLVSSVRPSFLPAQADIARATGGAHSAAGHGVLYVIACVGRGPVLRETVAPTTNAALNIASTFVTANQSRSDGGGTPNADGVAVEGVALSHIASVKVPELAVPDSAVVAVSARLDNAPLGTTYPLTDTVSLAAEQLQAEMPWTMARAIVRRATKETAVASLQGGLGIDGTAARLVRFAAISAWSGSEHADTRCWGLLPREIQVLRVELPVGTHSVELTPITGSGLPVGPGERTTVLVEDGRNHYLIAFAPDRALYLVSADPH